MLTAHVSRSSSWNPLVPCTLRWLCPLLVIWVGTPSIRLQASTEYCGLYAVYGASIALGQPIHFEELLKKEYINAPTGSSAAELVRALEDHQLQATVISGLTVESLRNASSPIIMHLAGGEQLAVYDHWILFLGSDGSRGLVVDESDGKHWVPLAQLLAKWDGNVVVVDRKKIGVGTFRRAELFWFSLQSLLLLGGMVAVTKCRSRWSKRVDSARRSYWQSIPAIVRESIWLVGVGVVAGLLIHATDSVGFFYNAGSCNFVAASVLESEIPARTLQDLQRMVDDQSTLLIDARFASDYARGTIPGAISIPVDVSLKDRAVLLEGKSRSQPVVIFCQSDGCSFAKVIANGLVREGFTKVSIFPGGWVEWKKGAASHSVSTVN